MRRKIGMLLMAAALPLPAAVQAQVRFPDYQYQPPGFQPIAPGVGIGLGGVGGLHTPGIPDIYDPMAGVRNQLEPHGPGIPFPPDGFGRPGNPYQPFAGANGLPQALGVPEVPSWDRNNATPPLRQINVPKFEFKPTEVKPASSSSSGNYWTYGGIVTAVLVALRCLGRTAGSSRDPSSRDRE